MRQLNLLFRFWFLSDELQPLQDLLNDGQAPQYTPHGASSAILFFLLVINAFCAFLHDTVSGV